MNSHKYKQILYFISIVILLTLCVQGYWSYKNYLSEKRQLITDVQVSLDNAVDSYYTQLAKKNTLSYISDSIPSDSLFMGFHLADLITKRDSLEGHFNNLYLKDSSDSKRISIIKSNATDSFSFEYNSNKPKVLFKNLDGNKGNFPKHFEMLTSKIVVSFSEDSLSLKSVDSLIHQELLRKNINVTYGISYKNNWGKDQKLRIDIIDSSLLKASAGSSFLLDGSSLLIHFNNTTLIILKRNATSLLLSFLLVSSIIICLLYLLKIIQKQKELAEIKNDLISNITHEFKTPLATINVALEGIQRFNLKNDAEKSKKYAEMSRAEVEKLTLMVEKLLETATLDSDSLHLNLEKTNLVSLLEKATTIDGDMLKGKTISLTSNFDECTLKVDRFHFENAINNILDNAIKYGGDRIEVGIQKSNSEIIILIRDHGNELTKQQSLKIFEKFYRVPKGNTHDIKGFGIGLYYAKNIIEKHGGTVGVNVKNGTEFIISIPNS